MAGDDVEAPALSDEDRELIQALVALGTTWEEMLANGLPATVVAAARKEVEKPDEIEDSPRPWTPDEAELEEGEVAGVEAVHVARSANGLEAPNTANTENAVTLRSQLTNLPPYDPPVVLDLSDEEDQRTVRSTRTPEAEDREILLRKIESKKDDMVRRIAALERKKREQANGTPNTSNAAERVEVDPTQKSLPESPAIDSLVPDALMRVSRARARLETTRARTTAAATAIDMALARSTLVSVERSITELQNRVAYLRTELQTAEAELVSAQAKRVAAEETLASKTMETQTLMEEESLAAKELEVAEAHLAEIRSDEEERVRRSEFARNVEEVAAQEQIRLKTRDEDNTRKSTEADAARKRNLEEERLKLTEQLAKRTADLDATRKKTVIIAASALTKRPAPTAPAGPPPKRIAYGPGPTEIRTAPSTPPPLVTPNMRLPGSKPELPLFDQWLHSPSTASPDREVNGPTIAQRVLAELGEETWKKDETIEFLSVIDGILARKDSHAGLSDLKQILGGSRDDGNQESHSVVLRKGETSKNDATQSLNPAQRLSLIKRRIAQSVVDPNRRFCLFELQGGSCNDPNCSSQHFMEVGVDDDSALTSFAPIAFSPLKEDHRANLLAHLRTRRAAGATAAELCAAMMIAWEMAAKLRVAVLGDLPRIRKIGGKVRPAHSTQAPNVTDESMPDNPQGVEGLTAVAADNGLKISELPFTEGLRKVLRGESAKSSRYYSDSDYERVISRRPQDSHLWLEYALDSLPSPLTVETLGSSSSKQFTKTLSLLTRALQTNRTSEDLWIVYLDLYAHRAKEVDTRELRSRTITDAVVCLATVYVNLGEATMAALVIRNLLFGKTIEEVFDRTSDASSARVNNSNSIASSLSVELLTPSDLCALWLLYFHLRWFGSIPIGMLGSPPNKFVVSGEPFLILWRKAGQHKFGDSSLVQTTGQLLYSMVDWLRKAGQSYKREFITMVINAAELMKDLRNPRDEIASYINQLHREDRESIELWYLKAESEGSQAISEYMQAQPCAAILWNCLTKLAVQSGDQTTALELLINCPKSYFEDHPG
ncbi:Zinc finger C3H1 domain-containing protein, partial [Gonapodya sp. JEL0774]